mgnify:FL=1
METVTIPREEYEYLKRLETIAQGKLLLQLTKKSKLTQTDVEEISQKINKDVFEELNKR